MQNTTCFTTISQKKKTHTGHYPRLLVCFAETKLIISTVLRCGKTCFYKGLAQSGMSSRGNEGHASSFIHFLKRHCFCFLGNNAPTLE